MAQRKRLLMRIILQPKMRKRSALRLRKLLAKRPLKKLPQARVHLLRERQLSD